MASLKATQCPQPEVTQRQLFISGAPENGTLKYPDFACRPATKPEPRAISTSQGLFASFMGRCKTLSARIQSPRVLEWSFWNYRSKRRKTGGRKARRCNASCNFRKKWIRWKNADTPASSGACKTRLQLVKLIIKRFQFILTVIRNLQYEPGLNFVSREHKFRIETENFKIFNRS